MVYHSAASGHIDFDSDLMDPIWRRLATDWEQAFQTRLPQALASHADASSKLLHCFHEAVAERANATGVGLASLPILKTQVNDNRQILQGFDLFLTAQANVLQREANRGFTSCIARLKGTVYHMCTTESGRGSYKWMKEHMRATS